MQKGFNAILIVFIVLAIGGGGLFALQAISNKNFPDRVKDLGGKEEWE